MTAAPAKVDDVLAAMLSRVASLAARPTPLVSAAGCVLAASQVAAGALPRFTNSAMDGYAIRAADTSPATPSAPIDMPVISLIAAGASPPQPLAPLAAARIMTGAPLPPGADAVIPFEVVTTRRDAVTGQERIAIMAPVAPAVNVRPAGSDVAPGAILASAGAMLTPQLVGLLAAAGVTAVSVRPRPRVALISTGDELLAADPAARIPDANGPLLCGMVTAVGGEVVTTSVAADDPAAFTAHLAALPPVDLVITSGGVSAGDFDPLRASLASDPTMQFWQVAMKPGRPLGFGAAAGRSLMALPGNPVAAAVSFTVFGRPLLARLAGAAGPVAPVRVRLASALANPGGRTLYARASLVRSAAGAIVAIPDADQRVSQISRLAAADALVIVPDTVSEAAAGQELDALLLRLDAAWLASLLRTAE